MSTIADAMKETITKSGETLYRVAQGSGVTAGQLSRFMSGERSLSAESLERLADYFGLEIVLRPKGRGRKARTT